MTQLYSVTWLKQLFEDGKQPEFFLFWGHTNRYNEEAGKFCFSQWYPATFIVDGIEYKTAEHWMMAQKAILFGDAETLQKIINSNTPSEAKKLGRLVSGFDETKWDDNRYDIVRLGNIHKFNQHPNFAEYLLNTSNKIIAEASPFDAIWGTGLSQSHKEAENVYKWRGLNLLGFALMEVRDFLSQSGRFISPGDTTPV